MKVFYDAIMPDAVTTIFSKDTINLLKKVISVDKVHFIIKRPEVAELIDVVSENNLIIIPTKKPKKYNEISFKLLLDIDALIRTNVTNKQLNLIEKILTDCFTLTNTINLCLF